MPRSPYALLLLLTTWCFWGGPEPEEVRDDDVPDDVLDPLLPPRPPSAPTSPTESVEPGEAPPSVGGIALPNDLTHLHRESLRRLAYPGWVVQADDPRALYDRSAGVTLSGPAQEAMLVCRAVLHGGGYDDSLFAGGADVYLRLRVGGGALRHTLQTPIRTYTFPLSELAPGDSVAVTVMDDDVFADDRIGSGSGTFGGGELVIDAGGASVTCRPVAPEVVQEGRERARRRLRAAVARLGTPRPRLDQPDFAYPMSAAGEVRAAIPPAHAWSVHSDPEVSAMVEQAAAFEEAWQDAIGTAIDDAVERLPPVGSEARLERSGTVSITAPACGEAAQRLREEHAGHLSPSQRCLITLTLVTDGRGELWNLGDEALTVNAITTRGAPASLHRVGLRMNDSWDLGTGLPRFRRGDRFFFVFELGDGAPPPLLQVQRRQRSVLLRLE